MNFEILAEEYAARLNSEEIVEENVGKLLAFLATGAGASGAFNYYITNYNDGKLPDWMTRYSDSYWWMGITLFDWTGLTSQVYFREAMAEVEANPDDEWAHIKMWLTFMATIPGTNFSPIGFIKFVTKWIFLKPVFIGFFKGIGRMMQSSGAAAKGIPDAIAKLSHEGVKVGNKDAAILFRESTEKALGIKVTDDAIVEAAKRNNLTLKSPGLVSTAAEKLAKGAAAAGKGTAKVGGKVAGELIKLGGKAGKLIGAGGALAAAGGKREIGKSTPSIMGPQQQFGWEGGRVGP